MNSGDVSVREAAGGDALTSFLTMAGLTVGGPSRVAWPLEGIGIGDLGHQSAPSRKRHIKR